MLTPQEFADARNLSARELSSRIQVLVKYRNHLEKGLARAKDQLKKTPVVQKTECETQIKKYRACINIADEYFNLYENELRKEQEALGI